MYTNEFITSFYEKMKTVPNASQRLKEFSEILGIKLYSHIHGHFTNHERNLIDEEYRTWALLSFLYQIDGFSFELNNESLLDQIGRSLIKDKNFLCTLLLME